MNTEITFTMLQLIRVMLAISAGIVSMAAGVGVVVALVKRAGAPNRQQNDRLTNLEERADRYDKTLETIEKSNRVTQRAILALLSHGIDGNELDGMRSAKNELTEFLIER